MNRFNCLILSFSATFLTNCNIPNGIKIIGVDSNGKPVQVNALDQVVLPMSNELNSFGKHPSDWAPYYSGNCSN